jgi:hypothetical protein
MDKFVRYHVSQWGYQHSGEQPSQRYVFMTGDRLGRRLSFQRRSLKRHMHKSIAAATIEALIAIINVLEDE